MLRKIAKICEKFTEVHVFRADVKMPILLKFPSLFLEGTVRIKHIISNFRKRATKT